MKTPGLITGCPRSGASWVSNVLSADPTIIRWQQMFDPDADDSLQLPTRFFAPERQTGIFIEGQIRERLESADGSLRLLRLAKDIPRFPSTLFASMKARSVAPFTKSKYGPFFATPSKFAHGDRVLVKDSDAMFALDWLAKTFGFKSVVVVRHPAAVIGSLMRRKRRGGHNFDIEACLTQPIVKERYFDVLNQFQDELDKPPMEISDLSLFTIEWCAYMAALKSYKEQKSDVYVARYESIAKFPEKEFIKIAHHLDIPWSDEIQRQVSALKGHKFDPTGWRKGVSKEDARYILRMTREASQGYYTKDDWRY